MSHSPPAGNALAPRGQTDDETHLDDGERKANVLEALNDADCRAILDATSDEALTASDVSDRCDIPQSTTYRKLELLTESGLLEERTRIRQSGRHTSEFVRTVDDVVASVDGEGDLTVTVTHQTDTAASELSAGRL